MTGDADVRYIIYYRNVYPDGHRTPWYDLNPAMFYRDEETAREAAKREAGKRYMSGHVTESRLAKQVVIETVVEDFR